METTQDKILLLCQKKVTVTGATGTLASLSPRYKLIAWVDIKLYMTIILSGECNPTCKESSLQLGGTITFSMGQSSLSFRVHNHISCLLSWSPEKKMAIHEHMLTKTNPQFFKTLFTCVWVISCLLLIVNPSWPKPHLHHTVLPAMRGCTRISHIRDQLQNMHRLSNILKDLKLAYSLWRSPQNWFSSTLFQYVD